MHKCLEHSTVENAAKFCYILCNSYKWLLDSYVADFYIHEHWKDLPNCWKETFKNISFEALANVIDSNSDLKTSQVLPLSLLTLRQLVRRLQILRRQQIIDAEPHFVFERNLFEVKHFRSIFWKRIKLKKQHEIEHISKMCYRLATQTNCFCIVDVGSGLGHLSRILSYGYGFKVCALEAQTALTREARKLDLQMEQALERAFGKVLNENLRPRHVNFEVEPTSSGTDVINIIKEAFNVPDLSQLQFGIVGLHPCGDLGIQLIKLFINFRQVQFINVVGCCYMKLTESLQYPISNVCKEGNYRLSYTVRELACHAIEAYVEKLKSHDSYQLKVHAYRAALEKLIVEMRPDLAHSQINSIKFSKDLHFLQFCEKATSNLCISINKSRIESDEIRSDLACWKQVVIFYSLRLMLAPVAESLIIFDRALFILESGFQATLTPIFDPKLSPRNHILTTVR